LVNKAQKSRIRHIVKQSICGVGSDANVEGGVGRGLFGGMPIKIPRRHMIIIIGIKVSEAKDPTKNVILNAVVSGISIIRDSFYHKVIPIRSVV
jgi:hypothetical protein